MQSHSQLRVAWNAIRLAGLLWIVLPIAACADGKVFPPNALPKEIKIPDQTALIVWSNGVERLVIETRFEGEGTNFAWVIPLPAEPVIEPATTGLFTTLRCVFRPVIKHNINPIWAVALAIGGICWLLLTVRRSTPAVWSDLIGCIAAGVGFGFAIGLVAGLAVVFGCGFAIYRIRAGREAMLAILLVLVFILLISSMMLPALGTAGGGYPSASGVRILNSQQVGVYETTTVSASDPNALGRWLEANGFALTSGSQPVIEEYVKEGWIFVAAKVHRESTSNALSSPHPLSFTFTSKQAVYPMRLTGVGNDKVSVELYVFGPERAAAAGFVVDECQQPLWPTKNSMRFSSPRVSIRHGLLREWAMLAPVATKLTATLNSDAMQQDVSISWEPFQVKRTTLYSEEGALRTGINYTVPVAVFVILAIAAVFRWRKIPLRRASWPILGITGICSLLALCVFLQLPKVQARLVSLPQFRAGSVLRNLALAIQADLPKNEKPTSSQVRELIQRGPTEIEEGDLENLLLGGTIQEEDSPGNYTLEDTQEGVAFIGYDYLGGKEETYLLTGSDQNR